MNSIIRGGCFEPHTQHLTTQITLPGKMMKTTS